MEEYYYYHHHGKIVEMETSHHVTMNILSL